MIGYSKQQIAKMSGVHPNTLYRNIVNGIRNGSFDEPMTAFFRHVWPKRRVFFEAEMRLIANALGGELKEHFKQHG